MAGLMRSVRRRSWAVVLVCLAVVGLAGCAKDPIPTPAGSVSRTGTVRELLSSSPSPCPTTGNCTLYPDRDTTVYSVVAKDYGKAHEMCVGVNGGTNGTARALLHFNLGLLPAHFFATGASMTINGRRGSATGALSLFKLTAGSWSEGNGTGLADGHFATAGCPTCGGTGACGWSGTGTTNGATFAVSNNVGAASATANFTLDGTNATVVTFGSLAADVRNQASTTNFGWSIRSSDETMGAHMVFMSTDTGQGDGAKPGLTVSYGRGPGSSGCSANSDCLFSNGATGACAGGFCCNAACDDGNPCTTDTCDGNGTCSHSNNGNGCNDSNACTTGDVCAGGICAGTAVQCAASDQCHNVGACNPANGVCSNPAKANGATCNDGNACTQTDTCQTGTCAGSNPVVCAALDQCHNAGACNTTTGACTTPNKGNGTTCDDMNTCTSGETCQNGVCGGGTGTVCTALDQCHDVGTCNAGVCTNPVKTNGASCSDGNACTAGDSCQNGSCQAGAPVTCTPLDQCHNAGTCNPANGTCSNPTKANGAVCDDGKFCTTPDACSNGVCSGAARVCNDGIACTVDGCSDAQGRCTTDPTPCGCAKDADCTDGNPCNGVEKCDLTSLACKQGTPVDCSSQTDDCNVGTCSPATGTCSAVARADSTVCDDGNACTRADACKSGKCIGANPVTCTALDQCHVVGVCNTGSGVCSNPAAGNGATCSDGSACTVGDKCMGGTCVSGVALDCTDSSPCTADACDAAAGCVHPPGNGGTVCGSAASCSGGKESLATACTGSGTTCPAPIVNACAPYACGTAACLKACTKDGDCAAGNYCAAGGKCTAKGGLGVACAANNQCASSFCADGVCCTDDCVGQCEACNLPSKKGTCSAVTGKPVAPRQACIGNGTGCDGTCNGVQTTACVVPGQSTQCRAPSCDAKNHLATLPEFCDGSGTCPVKRTQDCAPGICGVTQCTGCSTNASCPAGDFCRGGVCKPLAQTGVACSIDAECTSGHCIDGVCCNSDCTGQCEACDQAGHEGTCTAIAAGEDPSTKGRPGCANAGTRCGGICDGTTTRTCAYPGPGVVCRDADCQNGIATLVAFCDGSGSCPPEGQQNCPTGYSCANGLCSGGPAACSADSDCNNDQYCAGGICKPKNKAGTSCNISSECASGVCVDGVCCTRPCTGQCEACNGMGTEGTCTPITGAPRGSRQTCATDGTLCGGSCDGVTADRCTYKAAETACRVGSCKNGLADLPAFCQGNGRCAPRQQQSCDPSTCDAPGVACIGKCKVDTNCAQNEFCAAGICVAKLANGATCGAPSQCSTGQCVDGLCCDDACDGRCESCDQVDHLGTCVAVSGAPRDGRPSCIGFGACGGFCDGTSNEQCGLPGQSTMCGTAFCANGAAATAPFCNGAASCIIPTPASCDPYRCDVDSVGCATTCTVNEDCTEGLVCDTAQGGCVQPTPDGGTGPDASTGGAGGTDGGTGTGGASAGTGGIAGRSAGGNAGSSGNAARDAGIDATRDAGASARGDGGQTRASDSSGCGCRITGARDAKHGALAVMILSVLAARRRRGRRESASSRNKPREAGV
jgi:MYXO-CTERM domain-containing protein